MLCTKRDWLLWRHGSVKPDYWSYQGPCPGNQPGPWVLGFSNAVFSTPCAALVPALPPQSGDRDARRSGRGRAMQGCLKHHAGRAPPMDYPPGHPPGHHRPLESQALAPAGVSGNQRGRRAGGPGRGAQVLEDVYNRTQSLLTFQGLLQLA
ncbi:RIKEN cDNA, isoform CRA_a [Microtus ochrogaster]|uniref:Uncharacterized protein n=1 Tax=Microtus ochrogaster TaxID=79684 RepID=A0A8J6GR16_MICOH|nr:RIKEN cDNA, isoform CRA_a [Microtus ochrogaster]KAH0515371.1 RIKEN cDNA, isoform CRA_a [Microtus ochrogaster]